MIGTDSKADAVVQRLRQMVASRPVGARLPSERDLAAGLGVARMTARKAIESLTEDGWLERRPGSGTYVAAPPHAKTSGLSSFSEGIRRRGMTPSTRVLEFGEIPAEPDIAERLGLGVGVPVLRFTRLRLADGRPVGVETTWMAPELVSGLTADDLTGSLFEVLAERFGVIPGQASSTIDSVAADADTGTALDLGPGDPCLRVRMEYLDNRRRPLMAATCCYRGDRYELQVVLTPSAFSGDTSRAVTW